MFGDIYSEYSEVKTTRGERFLEVVAGNYTLEGQRIGTVQKDLVARRMMG